MIIDFLMVAALLAFFLYAILLKREINMQRQRIIHAEYLLSSYDTFLLIARTDRPQSLSVSYATEELMSYKWKWNKRYE